MIKHCPPRAQEKFVKFFTLSEIIQEIPFIRLEKFPQTGRAPPKIRAAGDAKGVFNMHPPPVFIVIKLTRATGGQLFPGEAYMS